MVDISDAALDIRLDIIKGIHDWRILKKAGQRSWVVVQQKPILINERIMKLLDQEAKRIERLLHVFFYCSQLEYEILVL